MKRSMLILAIVASTLFTASQVRAEEATPTPSPSGIRQERQELRTERQEAREENKLEREENKNAMKELKGKFNTTRASMRATMLTKKYEFINNRFDNIISRFDARLALLDAAKVASSKALLEGAKAKLVTAKTASSAVIAKLNSIGSSSTKVDFDEVKSLVKKAGDGYKAVNDALKLALKELKTVSKPALKAAPTAVDNAQ